LTTSVTSVRTVCHDRSDRAADAEWRSAIVRGGGDHDGAAGHGHHEDRHQRVDRAVERLHEAWSRFQQRDGVRCPINVAVHKGTLNLFRSYLDAVMTMESLTKRLGDAGGIFVSGWVRDDLADSPWAAPLQVVELGTTPPGLAGMVVYRLV
jgi:hypothetical protein